MAASFAPPQGRTLVSSLSIPPQAKEFQGLLFLLISSGFWVLFQFHSAAPEVHVLCSFHSSFTPLATQMQNANPVWFCDTLLSKHRLQKPLVLREIFIDEFGGRVSARGCKCTKQGKPQVTLNRVSASLPEPQRHLSCPIFDLPYSTPSHAHSPSGHPMPRGNILKLTAFPTFQGSATCLPLVCPDHSGHDRGLTHPNPKDPSRHLKHTQKISSPQ